MEETVKRLYLAAQKLRNITSPSDLARLLNASPQTLKNWETRGISKAGLIDAAKILDINIQWLETGYGEMRQPETSYPNNQSSKKHIYCHHSHELEIPFFDVDAMHIVWHGNYVKYLEVARCAFLASIGYDYDEMARQGYGWPIVKMDFKYIRPAQFGQRIRVDMDIVEIESCLRIDYTLRDAATGNTLTRASTTQAAVSIATGEMQFQTPESWLNAVRQHPTFQAA